MSRFKHFTRSMLSSYVFLGVNVLYTLASVPLALKYLSKAEFGLWALTVQIANYIVLIDLGMVSSVSRILIDCKDQRADGRYGAVIKCGFLVGAAQGVIALVVGLSLVWFMGGWLEVPSELAHPFLCLMIGQILITSGTLVTRMFYQVLAAWQRLDVFNYSQLVQLVVGFGIMWLGFWIGLGVYSMLAGAVLGWILSSIICAVICQMLGFWPRTGEWGRTSWPQFRELFTYGADVFMMVLGSQVIFSSQVVLVSRELGVEMAALWSVMTKAFNLVVAVVWRIVGNAMPAFAEMHVRQEHERFWHRYRTLFIIVNVMAGYCAVMLAVCNDPFVTLWTDGKFAWHGIDDILLGVWLVFLTQVCSNNALIVNLKQIKGLKYVYLLEGIVFIVVMLLFLRQGGTEFMLCCSIVCALALSWSNGLWRIGKLAGCGWKPLLWDWQVPLFRLLVIMVPSGVFIHWAAGNAPLWCQLALNCLLPGAIGAWALVRFALPQEVFAELASKLPAPLRKSTVAFRPQHGRSG